MRPAIIRRLNDINRRFYAVTAPEFDATRGAAWPGWVALLDHITPPAESVRVLDVGCGNGRFGVFLHEKWGDSVRYHGLDNNADLLAFAAQALPSARLEQRDVVENPPDAGDYDLVVAFGLLHHVPGAANRRAFVRTLAARVADSGYLAFACWRFYEFERFRERVVAWPDDLAPHVEAGDYLLDWRRGDVALRYCHYVDDAEQTTLIGAAGLDHIHTYRADGFNGMLNAYSVLRRHG